MNEAPKRPFLSPVSVRELLIAVAIVAALFSFLFAAADRGDWDREDWIARIVCGITLSPIAFVLVALNRGGSSEP